MRVLKRLIPLLLICLLLIGALGCGKKGAAIAEGGTTFDFSKVAANGLPSGWTITSYENQYTAETVDGVLMLSSTIADDCRLTKDFSVTGGTRYVFTAEVRTEGVKDGQGATLSIDNYGSDGCFLYSESLYGDNDWTTVVLAFIPDASQESVKVAFRIGGYSSVTSGTAWYRNGRLVQSDTAPVDFQTMTVSATEDTATEDTGTTADYENLFSLIFWLLIATFLLLFVFLYLGRSQFAKNDPKRWQQLLWFVGFLIIGAVLRYLLCAKYQGHDYDINCWRAWGSRMSSGGMANFYSDSTFCDYPPLYMWILGLVDRTATALSGHLSTTGTLFLYMVPAFMADVLLGAIVLLYGRRLKASNGILVALCGFVMLNPALLFLSGAWGQIDSILTLLLVVSFLLLNESDKRPWLRILSGVVYALAILLKWQALIFGPVLALVFLVTCFDVKNKQVRTRALLMTVAAVAAAFVVLWIGAWSASGWTFGAGLSASPLAWLFKQYQSASTGYPKASVEAYNFMALLGGNWQLVYGNLFGFATGDAAIAGFGDTIGALMTVFSKVSVVIALPVLAYEAFKYSIKGVTISASAPKRKRGAEPTPTESHYTDKQPLKIFLLAFGVCLLLHFIYVGLPNFSDKLQGLGDYPLYGFVLCGFLAWAISCRIKRDKITQESLFDSTLLRGAAAIGALLAILCITLVAHAATMSQIGQDTGRTYLQDGVEVTRYYGGLSYEGFGVLMIGVGIVLTVWQCLLYRKNHVKAKVPLLQNKGLVFQLAAFFIVWLFTFGHYMHERYIVPALVLLVFAYLFDHDKHKLFTACGLTATVFFNEMMAQYVVSKPADTFIRGGTMHNELLALGAMLTVALCMYYAASSMLFAWRSVPKAQTAKSDTPAVRQSKQGGRAK